MKHRLRIEMALLAFMTLPLTTQAASFSCTTAKGIAHAICADPELSKLDEQMAALYADAKVRLSPEGKHILLDGQRQWLKYRDNEICKKVDTDCLKTTYQERIVKLKSAVKPHGPFLFNQVYYYSTHHYSSTDPAEEGYTQSTVSFPRIDQPASRTAKEFNALVLVKKQLSDDANEEDDCDEGADTQIDSVLDSPSGSIITINSSSWFQCVGANAYGNDTVTVYLTQPHVHELSMANLFRPDSGWTDVLRRHCIATMADFSREAGAETSAWVKEIAPNLIEQCSTSPRIWQINKEALVLDLDTNLSGRYLADENLHHVSIAWAELRPYLVKNPPIPYR